MSSQSAERKLYEATLVEFTQKYGNVIGKAQNIGSRSLPSAIDDKEHLTPRIPPLPAIYIRAR